MPHKKNFDIPATGNILFRILLIIFLVEIINEAFTLFGPLAPEKSDGMLHLMEAVTLILISGPLLWLVIARPLHRYAELHKKRNDLLLDKVVEAVISLDRNGTISSCNTAAEIIFDSCCEQMLGKPAWELFKDGVTAYESMLVQFEESRIAPAHPMLIEMTGIRQTGAQFFMEVSYSRISLFDGTDALLVIRDISARKQNELEKSRLLSLMESTLESTADGILVVDADKHIVVSNRKYSEMWGTSPDPCGTNEINCINDAILGQLIDPGEFDGHICHIFESPDSVYHDVLHLKDGRVIERVCTPQIHDGTVIGRVSCYRDVTERAAAQKKVSESEARFRQIFEHSFDAILLMDAGLSKILDLNQVAARLFQHEKEEVLGRSPDFLFTSEEGRFISQQTLQLRSEFGYWVDKLHVRLRDDADKFLSVRCRMITLAEDEVLLCTIRDISERVRNEEENRAIEAKLIHTNKMTSLGVLVSGIAHEINNPNNFIMVSSELLTKAWSDGREVLETYYRQYGDFTLAGVSYEAMRDEIPGLLKNITEGSRRIRNIVSDLKEFARDGKAGMKGNLDINHVIQQAATIISHQIRRHTHHFTIKADPVLPFITGNPQQIEQVLINLIMNALQALPGPDRGVEVVSSFDRETGMVCVEVSDQGSGIPEDISPRVLDPFFTTRLEKGGTGLGLSISNSIIRDHNGTMSFTTSPSGTTFQIRIPAGNPTNRKERSDHE